MSASTVASVRRPPSPVEAALLGLLALAVAMGIGRFAFTPVLPVMLADAGLSVRGGAWLAAGNYAGYLAGALAAIRIAVDSRRAVVASLAAIAFATLAMGTTDSFAAWFAWRTAAGIASAFALVHVATWTGLQLAARPALNGVVFAGVGTSIVVTGAACALLVDAGATSPQLWLALGALALAAAAVAAVRLGADGAGAPAAPPPKVAAQAAPSARTGRTWPLIVCYGISGFGYIVPATFLPVMARATLDSAAFAWVWPVFGVAAALSTWFVARLVSPPRARVAWAVAQAVMAAGTVALLVGSGPAALFGAAIATGGTFVVITMAGFQVARQVVAPEAQRALTAALTSAFALGQIAGPVLVAVAGDGDAFKLPLAAAAVLLVASVALLAPRLTPPIDARPT